MSWANDMITIVQIRFPGVLVYLWAQENFAMSAKRQMGMLKMTYSTM
jgi:hypothetical protein